MIKVIRLQLFAVLLAVLLGGVLFSQRGAVSAFLAGMASFLPNALFALRLHYQTRRKGSPSVAGFFVGEAVKVGTILVLLVLTYLMYPGLHWGGWCLGLVLTLKANLFALMVKT